MLTLSPERHKPERHLSIIPLVILSMILEEATLIRKWSWAGRFNWSKTLSIGITLSHPSPLAQKLSHDKEDLTQSILMIGRMRMGSASPISTKIERLESGRIQIAIELDMPWRVFIKYPALGTLGQPGIVSEGSVFTEQLQHRRGGRECNGCRSPQ